VLPTERRSNQVVHLEMWLTMSFLGQVRWAVAPIPRNVQASVIDSRSVILMSSPPIRLCRRVDYRLRWQLDILRPDGQPKQNHSQL